MIEEKKWHALSIKDVFVELESNENGLSEKEAEERLKKYGLNQIEEAQKINPIKIFLEQFNSFLVYILFAAIVILAFIGHWVDFFVILFVIIFNASLGFIQQYRAEKAIQDLKKMLVLKTTVMRAGKLMDIDTSLLVPGDVIALKEGDKIPADARIFVSNDFEVNEAVLTGESVPVEKIADSINDTVEISEKKNMLFLGTTSAKGTSKAIVVSTGMSTEFGKIARILQEPETEPTPLQKKLNTLSKELGISVLFLIVILFFVGIFAGADKLTMFLTAVSLAVAAIPEGLAAVITLCLAFAVKRMSKVKALIRKLPAAETLGRVTVICSDKTGTMTREELKVTEIFCNNRITHVDNKFLQYLNQNEEARLLLKAGCLSSNARYEIVKSGGKETEYFTGDYTEKAIIKFARDYGFIKGYLAKAEVRFKEFPFSSERKMISIIRKTKDERFMVYAKGSPEAILEKCTKEIINGRIAVLNEERKKHLKREYETMASEALRVLAFGYKLIPLHKGKQFNQEEVESSLIFIGFEAMFDAPREEVKEAIRKCEEAGISIKMLTGDSLITAKAVAKQIGLDGEAIEGKQIKRMSDNELVAILKKTAIFARIDPEDKVRIASLLKREGNIVAMTGDGVNDAPALKKSDIGVAMGVRGSDVTREVADIVLLDDNFASIVNAVEEGRRVYDNIKKFTYYMVSTNFAEVLIVFLALMLGAKLGWQNALPLLPIQILWINLVTDGIIAITLSTAKAEYDVMKRKPENMSIITLPVALVLFLLSLFITIPILVMFNIYHENIIKAQTVVFTSLVFFEGFNAFNFSSLKMPVHKRKKSIILILAVLATFVLQVMLIYLSPLQRLAGTTFLSIKELAIIVLITSTILVAGEVYKNVRHYYGR